MSETYVLGIFRGLGLVQPFLQQRLQLAHVLEAQLQSLEAADGGLAEHLPCTHKRAPAQQKKKNKTGIWGGFQSSSRERFHPSVKGSGSPAANSSTRYFSKLTVKVPQSQAHVCLREAQSDAFVFQLLCKLFKLLSC